MSEILQIIKTAGKVPYVMQRAADKEKDLKGFIFNRDKDRPDKTIPKVPILAHDGSVAGFMMPRQEEGYPEWRTGAVYVDPKYRGQGLAAKALQEFGKDKGAYDYVEDDNHASKKSFLNAGYKPYKPVSETRGDRIFKGHWYANESALRSMGKTPIKTAEWTHTHDKTLPDGTKIDVLKLIELLQDRKTHSISLENLKGPSKSKRSGFQKKRLDKADTSYPLIARKDNFLLDGRHRYFKLQEQGNDYANVRYATADDINKVKTAVQDDSLYIHPKLREKIKLHLQAGAKGGRPGQWSARKSQMLAAEYRNQGGAYFDEKNRAPQQEDLDKWTAEQWTTHDGKPAARDGEMHRYLPAAAWEKLTPAQRRATDVKKLKGKGQFVPNTEAARHAKTAASKAKELIENKVSDRNILTNQTTGLSVELAKGRVDPVDLLHEINKKLSGNLPEGVASYLAGIKRQLLFREFAAKALQQQKYKFPPGAKGEESAEWKDLTAMRTGIPLVDASAKDLQTGHKPHNRARLLLARHSIRTLNLDPSLIAKWYKSNLEDYDPIINTYNVVQAASGITGSEPSYRKSNAITAAKKLDPHGVYTKTQGFEPELDPEKKEQLIKKINEGNKEWSERWKGYNRGDDEGIPLWPTKDKVKGKYFLQNHDLRAKGHFGSFYKNYLNNEHKLLKKSEELVPSALWLVKEALKTERKQVPETLNKTRNPSAVIIKGNPRWIKNNTLADKFYNGLANHLRSKKYSVSFDKGEPYTAPHKADLWIGHSRGVDRLQYAPEGTKTLDLTPHEHPVSHKVMARQEAIRKAYGAPNLASLPDHLKLTPPPHHYFFTKEMKAAIDKLTNEKAKRPKGGKGVHGF